MKTYWLLVFTAIVFLGCTAQSPPIQQTTDVPSPDAPTAVPTGTPGVVPTATTLALEKTEVPTSGPAWALYENLEYGFEFQHPNLAGECCRSEGPQYGNFAWVVTFALEETVLPGTDKLFDGLSLHNVENSEGLSLEEYLELEIAAQKGLYETRLGEEAPDVGTEGAITLDGQEGKLIAGYAWDGSERIYVPFPNSQRFLVITKIEALDGSFLDTFAMILASFRFSL